MVYDTFLVNFCIHTRFIFKNMDVNYSSTKFLKRLSLLPWVILASLSKVRPCLCGLFLYSVFYSIGLCVFPLTNISLSSYMVNCSSTSIPRIHNGERLVSSTNDAGKTGYPHAKGWNWTLILHHTYISTQNVLKI